MLRKAIVLILCLTAMCGCTNEHKETKSEMLERIIAENNYIILDVRTKEEYEEGHVVGALNIPYDELDEKVELDKDKTVMVYCRSGKRSSIAYKTLKDLGFDVIDLGAFETIDLEKE